MNSFLLILGLATVYCVFSRHSDNCSSPKGVCVAAVVLLNWTVWGKLLHALQPPGTAPLTSTGVNSLTIQSSEAPCKQPVGERNLKNFIFRLALKLKWFICRISFKRRWFFLEGVGNVLRSHIRAFKCVSDLSKQVCSTCLQSRLEFSFRV